MGKKKQDDKSPVAPIDIKKIEEKLPNKKTRSHHIAVKSKGLYKSFKLGKRRIPVLKDINLNLYSGEFVIVYGPSGCGKSTFLHTILGLEAPTRGEIFLRRHNLYEMDNDKRTNFRREKIGMVFQQSNWIKSLNVWENVAYPLWLSGYTKEKSKQRALEVLEELEMGTYAYNQPTELSGGEQQRVSLARALSTNPWIIMADEPTGNLDTTSSEEIILLLARLNREKRRMILMVTHELSFLPIATRRVGIKDGEVVYDEKDGN